MDRSPKTRVIAIALIAAMAVGSIVLWLGIPVFWLFVASRVADSSQPSLGPYLMVMVGIPASMVVVGKLLSKLNRVYGEVTHSTPTVRVQMPWHKSMRGERDSGRPRQVLDVVMVCSVGLALFVFAFWFFVFAGSSLPT